jgi:transcriptional regulator with XRE-family HTH domain
MDPTYDGTLGTAGGPAFGAALSALAAAEKLDAPALAAKAGLPPATVAAVLAGEARIGVPAMARLARALRLKAVEFMQQSGLLSLEVYAMGLDPLYFLPDGQIRFDARIYMREINPRHAVPEGDMLKRNPVLKALIDDPVIDPIGKIEIELTYLLRAAVQSTGGNL